MRNPFDIVPIAAAPMPGQLHHGNDGDGTAASPTFPFDAVSAEPPVGRVLALSFDADWRAYFRLWVVCQLLALLTLGVYGPWARARRAAFMARHWHLDGHPFEVALEPRALLLGRALLLLILMSGLALSWLWPELVPVLVAFSYAALPWLMAHSFALRWRTLSYRGMPFGAATPSAPLRRPLWLLGGAMALLALPFESWLGGAGPMLGGVLWIAALGFLVWSWPNATAALTHHRFSQAGWGATPFELDAGPDQILEHMWRFWIDKGALLFLVLIYVGLLAVALGIENRDWQALLHAVGYLVLTVFTVTFARGRRLNFVLHRLTLGGLAFSTTMPPARAAWLTAGYALLALCTLGLSIPWSTVHYARWRAARVQLHLQGEWSQFGPGAAPLRASGVMDELANSFDIEIGI
jgi:uncharacterized membrane protein YjgN (DUF898 family)